MKKLTKVMTHAHAGLMVGGTSVCVNKKLEKTKNHAKNVAMNVIGVQQNSKNAKHQ